MVAATGMMAIAVTPAAARGGQPTSKAVAAAAAITVAGGVHTISPEVSDPVATGEGFYNFTVTAPGASTVLVNGSWGLSYTNVSYPLAQATPGGPWTGLVGPLTPGVYSYSFVIDGVAAGDPDNVNIVHSSPTLRTFLAPGPAAAFLTPHPGAHGRLSVMTYHSAVTNSDRSATVWTPPGYSANRRTAYPTFYLVHGGGGDYLDWIQQGDANAILDNLYAAHRLTPMVVVMPDGNITGSTGLPEDDNFPAELLGSLIPAVQRTFNVSGSASQRALAGLSLGGLQTFNTLFDDPGAFRLIGDFSSGYFPPVIDQIRAQDAALLQNPAVNKRTSMFRIYIGNQADIAYQNNILTRKLFDDLGVHYQFAGSYPKSGHVWKTWQYDLKDFAPRLFD
jgi:enterochelin esterase-like enzyme